MSASLERGEQIAISNLSALRWLAGVAVCDEIDPDTYGGIAFRRFARFDGGRKHNRLDAVIKHIKSVVPCRVCKGANVDAIGAKCAFCVDGKAKFVCRDCLGILPLCPCFGVYRAMPKAGQP